MELLFPYNHGKGGLANQPLNLWHEWLIPSFQKQYPSLHIHYNLSRKDLRRSKYRNTLIWRMEADVIKKMMGDMHKKPQDAQETMSIFIAKDSFCWHMQKN